MTVIPFDKRYKPISLAEHIVDTAQMVKELPKNPSQVINLVTAFLFEALEVKPEGNNVEKIRREAQESLAEILLKENKNIEESRLEYSIQMLVDLWASARVVRDIILRSSNHKFSQENSQYVIWDVGSWLGILALAALIPHLDKPNMLVYLIDHSFGSAKKGKEMLERNIKDSSVHINPVWADVSGYTRFHPRVGIPSLFSSSLKSPDIVVAEIINNRLPSFEIKNGRVLIEGEEITEENIYPNVLAKDPYIYFLDSFLKDRTYNTKNPLIWPFPNESLYYSSKNETERRWMLKGVVEPSHLLPLPVVGADFWGFQHFLSDPSLFTFRWMDKYLLIKVSWEEILNPQCSSMFVNPFVKPRNETHKNAINRIVNYFSKLRGIMNIPC